LVKINKISISFLSNKSVEKRTHLLYNISVNLCAQAQKEFFMKKKLLLLTVLVIALTCIFAISVFADDTATDPYADYYNKVYTAIDGTEMALYEKEEDTYYPLAWFYNSTNGTYESFRVGTEVVFAPNGKTTEIPYGTVFKQDASVVFADTTKTYTMANLILVNLHGTRISHFSGSWTNLPIQAIYCNVEARYINGSTFNKNQSLSVFDIPKAHSGAFNICGFALSNCPKLKELYIPKNAYFASNSSIEYSGLERVEFAPEWEPKSWFGGGPYSRTIAGYTFNGCASLQTVILPNNIDSIGTYAFNKCTSLEEIYIPNGTTTIGAYAFNGCSSITSVSIPAGITLIGNRSFQNCSALASLEFRGNAGENATIEIAAFEGCLIIGDVAIPEGFTTFGEAVFQAAGVTNLSLPTTLTTLDSNGKQFCVWGSKVANEYKIKSVTGLENTQITSIPNSMFRGQTQWNADVVRLPNTVASTGTYSFADCAFYNIYLGAGLTSLGNETFTACANLKNVYMPGTITTFGSNPFYGKGVYFLVTSSNKDYLDTINAKAGSSNDYVSYADYKANPDNYKSGKYIIYGLNLCETFYNGHDTNGVVGKNQFKGEAYITDYICASGCNRKCGMQAETLLCGPLFENKGYSKIADGTMFTYGIVINEENIAAYVALTGKAFNYGVIIGAANFDSEGNLVDKDAIIDSTGKSLIDNSIVVNFANVALDNFTIYNVKMLGIETEAQRKLPIYCCAYIIDGDAVSYMGNSVTTAAKTISCEAITVIEATTPPTSGEDNA
jgi:hypothetical protein